MLSRILRALRVLTTPGLGVDAVKLQTQIEALQAENRQLWQLQENRNELVQVLYHLYWRADKPAAATLVLFSLVLLGEDIEGASAISGSARRAILSMGPADPPPPIGGGQ